MAALYRDADLMLNPSRVDNMPNAILGGAGERPGGGHHRRRRHSFIVTQGHTAMLVPPDDPQAMADAAHKVLADTGLRAALVAAGCAEVQRYRWSSVRAQLLSAYAGCDYREEGHMNMKGTAMLQSVRPGAMPTHLQATDARPVTLR